MKAISIDSHRHRADCTVCEARRMCVKCVVCAESVCKDCRQPYGAPSPPLPEQGYVCELCVDEAEEHMRTWHGW